jgi:hypothetical protein
MNPDVTSPGVVHEQRMHRLIETFSIRERHTKEMQRDGWTLYFFSGGYALVSPFFCEISEAIDEVLSDFEVTEVTP